MDAKEKENIRKLTASPYYMALAKCSDKAFLDDKFKAYLFQAKRDAKEFCGKIPGTRASEKAEYIDQRHKDRLYDNGADFIKILEMNSTKYAEIPLTENDVKKGFYNHRTNSVYMRYALTCSKNLLEELGNCNMIATVKIPPRKECEVPEVSYGAARVKDRDKQYLILFTTMQAFKKWNENDMKNIYHPLYVTPEMLKNIRDGRGVLINLHEENMILESNILDMLEEGRAEKGKEK